MLFFRNTAITRFTHLETPGEDPADITRQLALVLDDLPLADDLRRQYAEIIEQAS